MEGSFGYRKDTLHWNTKNFGNNTWLKIQTTYINQVWKISLKRTTPDVNLTAGGRYFSLWLKRNAESSNNSLKCASCDPINNLTTPCPILNVHVHALCTAARLSTLMHFYLIINNSTYLFRNKNPISEFNTPTSLGVVIVTMANLGLWKN